jgi:hypothetical protein
MYRQVFIPDGQNINIPIPQQWRGREVEVIAFPVSEDADEEQSLLAKRKELDEAFDQYLFDFSDVQQVLKMAPKKEVQEIKNIFANYRFNKKDFKFDRDEANNYE